jgi:hypothetical protein
MGDYNQSLIFIFNFAANMIKNRDCLILSKAQSILAVSLQSHLYVNPTQ